MKFRPFLLIPACALLLINCKPSKKVTTNTDTAITVTPYRPAKTKINNLVHTELTIEPDFEKKELKGEALLTLTPHFYQTDSATIQARYMRIESVEILLTGNPMPALNENDNKVGGFSKLNYTYDSVNLRIQLNRFYKKDEKYVLRIKYVAQPEKCKSELGTAIRDNKGMYFINTDNKDNTMPVQIWTQGETEAASCWFPTIDAPNQKTTQKITVTVPDEYRTISNGLMISSTKNGTGKRTDIWVQNKPHAPYLFALAIGKFSETKDMWRNKEVNYYVEEAYAPYARMVFGNTPQMIEFYSTILGVDYPWDKYHQVVVREFVSGAMENTGCVIHYDKLQHNSREHLDNTCEDIIAHELFHHWFGDLVTCESWSNLPLNESFATYGEYLWNEHKYGRKTADLKFDEFVYAYLSEAEEKQENLIRYHYEKTDDMFDRHSYQKGGAVLHMLRKYMGDEAFFKALNLYLTRKAYQSAEIHDLRLICEEVTGEDLNWFFDQWFMGSGHPVLEVKHQTYNNNSRMYAISIVQKGDKKFKLPVDIDFVNKDGVTRHRIIIEKDSQTFVIPCPLKPETVIFDAEYQLLGVVDEDKTIPMWEAQLKKSALYANRLKALKALDDKHPDKSQKLTYYKTHLNDSFWYMRETALDLINNLKLTTEELRPVFSTISDMATSDPKSDVRRATVPFFTEKEHAETLKNMLDDSSYYVVTTALARLGSVDRKAAYEYANQNRTEENDGLQERIFMAVGQYSEKNEIPFFIDLLKNGNKQTYENAKTGLFFFTTYNERQKFDDALIELMSMAEDKDFSERGIKTMNELKSFLDVQLLYLRIYSNIDKVNKKFYSNVSAELQSQLNKLNKVLTRYPKPAED